MSKESDQKITDEILAEGRAHPLPKTQMERLLTAALEKIRDSAAKRGDMKTLEKMPESPEEMAAKIVKKKRKS